MLLVARNGLRPGAQIGLLTPHARDPGAVTCDRALEGLDLANLAAIKARAPIIVEAINAVLANIARDRLRIGIVERQAALIAPFQPLEQ